MRTNDIDNKFAALANEDRRKIIAILSEHPMNGAELRKHLPTISQPTMSRQLKTLKDAGLVTMSRPVRGPSKVYTVNTSQLKEVGKVVVSLDLVGLERMRAERLAARHGK